MGSAAACATREGGPWLTRLRVLEAENAVVQDDTEAADLEAAMPSVPTTVPARAADEEDEEEEEEPEAASAGKARARQAVPA